LRLLLLMEPVATAGKQLSIHAMQPTAVAPFNTLTRALRCLPVAAGSIFLGALAAAPALVEGVTGLTAFRGFAGTSVLILVGVATDTARRFRSELAMQKYRDIDRLYDDIK
jgi:preprotein translocase subunit SecY